MILAEPIQIALEVAEILDRLGVPWYVGGSVASSLYGMPRLTQDVDIVASLRPEHAEALCEALGARFYVDLDTAREEIRRRRTFNAIHQELLYKVDLYVQRADRMSREQMEQRTQYALGDGRHLWVARAEHIVVHKLLWYRTGGEVSDRQWSDVVNVLFVRRARLDEGVMREWAAEVGVGDLLERALTEAAARG